MEAAYTVARSRFETSLEDARTRLAALAQRRAEHEIARKQLADASIRAPFDGTIQARLGQPRRIRRHRRPHRAASSKPTRSACASKCRNAKASSCGSARSCASSSKAIPTFTPARSGDSAPPCTNRAACCWSKPMFPTRRSCAPASSRAPKSWSTTSEPALSLPGRRRRHLRRHRKGRRHPGRQGPRKRPSPPAAADSAGSRSSPG